MNMKHRRASIHVTSMLLATILATGAAYGRTSENETEPPSNRPYVYLGDYDTEEVLSSRGNESSKLEKGLSSAVSYRHDELGLLLVMAGLTELSRRDAQSALQDEIRVLYGRLLEILDGAGSEQTSSKVIPEYISDFINDVTLASNYVDNANAYAPLVKCILRRAEALGAFEPKSFVSSVNDMFKLEYPNFYGTANLVRAVWLVDKMANPDIDSLKADTLRQLCIEHARIAVDSLRSDYGKSLASYLLAKRLSSSSKDEAWEYLRSAIEPSVATDFPQTAFYSDVYNGEVYVNEAVLFIPSYCEHLNGKSKNMQVLEAGEYLLDLGLVSDAQKDRIARAVIFWTERAIRDTSDPDESAALFRRLQRFYELDDPETKF